MRPEDLIIAVAYFSIPIQIVLALLQYPRLRSMQWSILVLAILFALFIFLCGAGHLLRCLEMADGAPFQVLNVATAVISLTTALYLLPLIPHLFDSLDKTLSAEIESKRKLMTFMSFLCHEIRNPLFSITSTITFMGDDNDLSSTQRKSLECIEQSAELMIRLVNDVLDLSKLESGKLQLEHRTFDLKHLLQGASESIKSGIGNKRTGKVHFELDIQPSVPQNVVGDSSRILQLVYNLLSNSAKFTDHGRIVLNVDTVDIVEARESKWVARSIIEASDLRSSQRSSVIDDVDTSEECATDATSLLDAEEGRHHQEEVGPRTDEIVLKLEVSDTGVGISSERQKHIFEPYSQAKLSDYRKYGGTGLGLSIVSKITESMGGTIHLQSTVGKGSTFTIFLPMKVVISETCTPLDALESSRSPRSDEGTRESPFNSRISYLEKDLTSDLGAVENHGNPETSPSESHQPSISDTPSKPADAKKSIHGLKSKDAQQASTDLSKFGTVLVVDDNAINRKILIRMLKQIDVEYSQAENGKEAVEYMEHSRNYTKQPQDSQVGLILMDWSMPVMDGCEATKVIRNMNLDLPIVSLTACALEEGFHQLKEAGSNEIVTKPIRRDDLHQLCRKYLSSSHTRRER